MAGILDRDLRMVAFTSARFPASLYIRRTKHAHTMSDHEQEGHFPEEAEQNEIGNPVVLTIMVLAMVILILWASC